MVNARIIGGRYAGSQKVTMNYSLFAVQPQVYLSTSKSHIYCVWFSVFVAGPIHGQEVFLLEGCGSARECITVFVQGNRVSRLSVDNVSKNPGEREREREMMERTFPKLQVSQTIPIFLFPFILKGLTCTLVSIRVGSCRFST